MELQLALMDQSEEWQLLMYHATATGVEHLVRGVRLCAVAVLAGTPVAGFEDHVEPGDLASSHLGIS